MVAIQTAQGVKMVPASAVQARQIAQQRQAQAQAARAAQQSPVPSAFEPSESETETPATESTSKAAPPSPTEVHLAAGAAVSTIRRAKAAGLSLLQQRTARKGVRKLAEDLSEAPESDWVGVITAALTSQVDIFHYIQAVTVYAALAEAQVPVALAEKIVSALKGSGMVPEGVLPYDEADFEQMQKAASEDEGEASEGDVKEGGSDVDA